jgi:transcriptional regulator with XRE-family HTH domain
MLGEKIRQVRHGQKRSLADVAKKAKISVATLSRIENDKQTLDVSMFLMLARVLDVVPQELLGELVGDAGEGLDPLVRKIARIEGTERAALWRALAASRRHTQPTRSRRTRMSEITEQVDELLAQVEFVRDELEAVRRRLRQR